MRQPTAPQHLRIGTRASALAMQQTHAIVALLQQASPGLECEIVPITTHGDRFQATPITEMGAEVERGIFNSALEQALLSGEADLVTCSFKDVESERPEGIAAHTAGHREDPRDVLVSRHGVPLAELPQGAVLATSSPRRVSQLARLRPDLRFEPLRGNVNTRIEQAAQRFDGIILAAAGVLRLGLQAHITQRLEPEQMLPAPAQGAMGCQYLSARVELAPLLAGIRDEATETCAQLEKAMLVRLSGGCFAPVGVLATLDGTDLRLRVRVASGDGTRCAEADLRGPASDGEALVAEAAEAIAAQGGLDIVAQMRAVLQGGE